MPLMTVAKNIALNALKGTAPAKSITLASLHTASPGTNGANEVAGGSPAYARKSITWNDSTASNLDSSNQPVFDIPAGTTVAYVGYWAADGTFMGSSAVTNEAFAGQGTYTLLDADINLIDA